MDLGIKGKTVFCTGGSKGMGRHVAGLLAAEGCRVAVVARTKADVDKAVEEIKAAGGSAIGVYADVSKEDEVKRAVAETTAVFGVPLIVVGQALFTAPGDFADIEDLDTYVQSFRAYTMSSIYLLHAVLPGMKAAGWGRFVHIGSATAKEPAGYIHHVVANATRPSTIGLLKTVSDEYAQFGITINTVAPGWVSTANSRAYIQNQVGLASEEERRAWMREQAKVPAARMGEEAEAASLVAYLCSQQAGYINGEWIAVDGGLHRSAF
ncbi:MAG: SDR family oxidoreductase [Rhodocyclaceae bacterium]|jgi:3-oxoacyl-[acyl-carrier protein] reductase|nr:SDR family oxidoreductase [Rhodocyclaceae bacterium]